MPSEKSEAIILHTYNLTDSSKIVVLLTPMRGKIRAVAKGVRRTKSKFGSALEPITHIEAQINFKDGRDLQNLSQAVTRESFAPIRSDLSRLGLASIMSELMEQFVQENEESSRPFVLLLLSLQTLARMSKNYSSLLISFYLKLLDIAGILPDLTRCALCKQEIGGSACLNRSLDGMVCTQCGGGGGERVNVGSLKIMRRLFKTEWVMLERIRVPVSSADEILALLNTYVSYHTGRELRSAKFLRSVTNLKGRPRTR
jgi:DNA repair protein RecO (recombination protein O)